MARVKNPILYVFTKRFIFMVYALMLPCVGFAAEYPSFAPIVQRVMPAVVNIAVTYEALSIHPFFSDPFFRDFFGVQVPAERVQQQAIGSGTVIRKDGIILTCAHVIQGAKAVKVNLHDGRSFDAKVIFSNTDEDIAFLKLVGLKNNEDLPTVELGNPGERKEGDWVIAIGYPEGSSLVTSGIIASSDAILGNRRIMKVTADLGPGMSGGGVFDINGKLIAVPNAILAKLSTLTKHGFAIPIAVPLKYLKSLDNAGNIKQPWHGIRVETALTKMRQKPSSPQEHATVIVVHIHPQSPAGAKGLLPGDQILSVNGKNIRNQEDFYTLLGTLSVGEAVDLIVRNDHGKHHITYNVAEATAQTTSIAPADGLSLTKGLLSGLTVAPLPGGNHSIKGVRVIDVQKESVAAQSLGIEKGDIIQKVNQKPIQTPEDLTSMDLGNSVAVTLNRRGVSIMTSVTMMGE